MRSVVNETSKYLIFLIYFKSHQLKPLMILKASLCLENGICGQVAKSDYFLCWDVIRYLA